MYRTARQVLWSLFAAGIAAFVVVCFVHDCRTAEAQVKPIATYPINLASTSQVTGTLTHGNGGTDVVSAGANGNILTSNGSSWTSAAPAIVSLTTGVSGTLAHGHGGTDITSPGANGNILTSNGTNWTSAAPASVSLTSGVSGTLPHGNGGTDITSPGANGNILTSNGSNWTSAAPATVNLTSGVTGTLSHGNGGTDITSPGANGNILTSNGTNWTSAAPAVVSLTSGVSGTLPHGNGGTDVTSPGASGNVLTSNGTNWVSQTPATGSGLFASPVLMANTIGATSSTGSFSVGSCFYVVKASVTVVGVKVWEKTGSGTHSIKVRVGQNSPSTSTLATATNAAVADATITEIDFSTPQTLNAANIRYCVSAWDTGGANCLEIPNATPGYDPAKWLPQQTTPTVWASGVLYAGYWFATGDGMPASNDTVINSVEPVFQ